VPYGKVVQVMGVAQKAGLNRIGFVADPFRPGPGRRSRWQAQPLKSGIRGNRPARAAPPPRHFLFRFPPSRFSMQDKYNHLDVERDAQAHWTAPTPTA
jgi:hypothetical protein